MWKCYVGRSIEFRGTYMWTAYHANTMLKFNWIQQSNIAIGKGFSLSPKLIHTYPNVPPGFPLKNPSLPTDLNLIVTGPGLPPNGKEVNLSWGPGSCLSGGKKHCRQFMNMEVLEAWSPPSRFTMEFVSGYSEQEFGMDEGNIAFWRICLDGPFEHVLFEEAKIRPWSILSNLLLTATPWWAIYKIEECGETSNCDINIQPSINEISETMLQFANAQVPASYKLLHRESLEKLEHMRASLIEVEPLIKRSNEVDLPSDKLDLRASAIEHLKEAHAFQECIIALLDKLDQVFLE